MLHHVSVGVRDVERAARFYDAALGALGYKRTAEYLPYAIAYGVTTPAFWIQLPHNQQAPNPGNGAHVGFSARDKSAVHTFYEAALAHGGRDDGEPGPREMYGPDYYGAFVFDLDGNKVEATLHAEAFVATRPARKATNKRTQRAPKRAARKRVKKKARRR